MGTVDTKQELKQAINELANLLNKKELIESEIAKQRRKVAAWQELCATDDDNALDVGLIACGNAFMDSVLDLGGLTEACRTVLRGSRIEWMTITEIQSELKQLGFALEKYKAPAASITTTINRMVESKEVAVSLPDESEMYEPRNAEDLRKFANLPAREKITQAVARSSERVATKTKYKWIGPNYGAPNSLANLIADRDREKLKESQELSARVQRRLSK